MVKMTMLSGPWEGRTRSFQGSLCLEAGEVVDIGDLLFASLRHGWEWAVDYSAATDEEIFQWLRVDITARILRALRDGRPVTALGKVFICPNPEELEEVAQSVEDYIADSGRLIALFSDDDDGVVIRDKGPVQ